MQRNIRRFKVKHSITKSTTTISKQTDLASTTTKTQQQNDGGDDDDKSRVRISTESMSTTTTMTTTTTTMTTTNVGGGGNLNSMAGTTGNGGAATAPTTENNQFWFRKPPERIGSGVNDGYFVNDDSDIKLNPNTYKRVYVAKNNDVVFYKLNSLRRAKEVQFTFSQLNLYNLETNCRRFFSIEPLICNHIQSKEIL